MKRNAWIEGHKKTYIEVGKKFVHIASGDEIMIVSPDGEDYFICEHSPGYPIYLDKATILEFFEPVYEKKRLERG